MQETVRQSAKGLWFELLWTFILSLTGYFALNFLCMRFMSFARPYLLVAVILLFVGLFTFILIRYFTFEATLFPDRIERRAGVIIKRRRVMSLCSVISVKTLATPLMRVMSLKYLILIFEGSVCILPPLKDAEVQKIYSLTARDTYERA